MNPKDKYYWNGKKWYPDRMDFQDGSACIIYEGGSMIIIEACVFYNAQNSQYYFWCSIGPFSLNCPSNLKRLPSCLIVVHFLSLSITFTLQYPNNTKTIQPCNTAY